MTLCSHTISIFFIFENRISTHVVRLYHVWCTRGFFFWKISWIYEKVRKSWLNNDDSVINNVWPENVCLIDWWKWTVIINKTVRFGSGISGSNVFFSVLYAHHMSGFFLTRILIYYLPWNVGSTESACILEGD